MGEKSRAFRAQARRLEDRAENATSPKARAALTATAQLWRQIARQVEQYERSRINLNLAIPALSRAVSLYGKLEEADRVPELLEKLAGLAEEAWTRAIGGNPSEA